MIGKTVFFVYKGEQMTGEVIDKILMYTGRIGYAETGYLILGKDNRPLKVPIDDISKVINE